MVEQERAQVSPERDQQAEGGKKITAVEALAAIRRGYDELGDELRWVQITYFIAQLGDTLEYYDAHVKELEIQVESLKKEHAEDETLNAVASQYGITLNQVKGFMDMCEQMNRSSLDGSGIVCVPFWFHAQYNELKRINESLNEETENLMHTLKKVNEQSPIEKMGLEMPQRTSIITGVTQPYIPGTTGPRPGDEYLDVDNSYPR